MNEEDLISPDELEMGLDVFDQLSDTNIAEVDTSMPIIRPGTYELQIVRMERKLTDPNEKNPNGGSMIVVHAKTTDTTMTDEGVQLAPGFPVRGMIWLVKSENYDPLKKIAMFVDSVFNIDDPEDRPCFDTTFESYTDQTVWAKIKIRPAEGSYPRSNEIDSYVSAPSE